MLFSSSLGIGKDRQMKLKIIVDELGRSCRIENAKTKELVDGVYEFSIHSEVGKASKVTLGMYMKDVEVVIMEKNVTGPFITET